MSWFDDVHDEQSPSPRRPPLPEPVVFEEHDDLDGSAPSAIPSRGGPWPAGNDVEIVNDEDDVWSEPGDSLSGLDPLFLASPVVTVAGAVHKSRAAKFVRGLGPAGLALGVAAMIAALGLASHVTHGEVFTVSMLLVSLTALAAVAAVTHRIGMQHGVGLCIAISAVAFGSLAWWWLPTMLAVFAGTFALYSNDTVEGGAK